MCKMDCFTFPKYNKNSFCDYKCMAFITFKWHKNRTFVEDRLPVTGLFFQRKAFMSRNTGL